MDTSSYIFFRLPSEDLAINKLEKALGEYTVEVFAPTLFQLKKHSTKTIIYLFWLFLTKGEYRIIYVSKGDTIVHYTHILPKFFKFPFMYSNDLEIGPAWTDKLYRGKGIFPAVITYVVQRFKKEDRSFYAFTHVDNIASQKAILKAGFKRWTSGYKTRLFGIYMVRIR